MRNPLLNADEPNRRRFMATAAKTLLGVGAARAFMPNAGAALGPNLGLPGRANSAKSVIYLYMSGGMTHMDTFDPKVGHENQGPTKAIPTNVDGIQISEYLPQLANHADKMAIVRSMSSTAGAHQQANYLMHTSYDMRATIRHPGVGAWLQKFHGRLNPNLPGSVFIGGSSRINGGSGFFESSYEPLTINDPNAGLKNSKRRGVSQEVFNHRLSLAESLDADFHDQYDLKKVRAYTSMYDDAVRIMTSEDLEVFDLKKEDDLVRETYGENPFGQGCLLARRLVEHDMRSVEVDLGGWDMHNNTFIAAPEKCAILDQALSALLADLNKRGMLEDTLVVLATEFGRTPRINQNEGRDHFPAAFSCVLAGGGIKGGLAYGKTSDDGEKVEDKLVKVEDFNATIAYALGIPLDSVLYSPSKRPFTVSHKGKPVLELFA
ncbi:MAG: DUF1501 domain-containing protein [Verrucomicrobiales bacterium]|nr:DUF1501 domain-containing protein [Verrucomicrobiales bacterium]